MTKKKERTVIIVVLFIFSLSLYTSILYSVKLFILFFIIELTVSPQKNHFFIFSFIITKQV